MLLKKWNYKKHDYEDYDVSDAWNVATYCGNLDEIINCAQCGTRLRYGYSYTSLEVHTAIGFGFCVCQECYEKESERRKIWKSKSENI